MHMEDLLKNKKYQNLRTIPAAIAVISLRNVFMIKMEYERSLLFSAFLPVLGANYSVYISEGTNQNLAMAAGVGLILLFYLCYVFSRKNWKWMMVAFARYLIDTWFLIYFVDVRGLGYNVWAFDIITHVGVLALLLYTAMLGQNGEKKKPEVQEEQPAEKELDNKMDYIIED